MEAKKQQQGRQGTRRVFTMLWFAWVMALIVVSSSPLYDTIQATFSDPIFFRTREALKQTPPLSPRLKILALDDGTIGFLRSAEPDSKDFVKLIENIARQKPKAILLDKMFGIAQRDPQHTAALDALRNKGIPVYAGSWVNPAKLEYREVTPLDADEYNVRGWVKGDTKDEETFIKEVLPNQAGFLYSYDPVYNGVFKGIGQIGYDTIGSVNPVLIHEGHIVPHLSFYAADTREIRDSSLLVNDKAVPLTEKGSVIVNHRPVSMFFTPKILRSMRFAINRARNGVPEEWIQEGDVVVVLFNFYTGSTDTLEEAPFGHLPGGLLVSTMVDSVLENRWIKPIGHVPWIVLVLSLIGALLARKTGPVFYWVVTILVALVYFGCVMYVFAYKDVMISWVLPLVGLIGGGTIPYVERRLGGELKAIAMENQYLVERALRLEEEKTKVQLAERLNLGRAIQQILLPPQGHQDHGDFTFAMSYIPAQEMSGDWIYIWGKDSKDKRIIIGDVVGKGPSAAIPVAILIGILGECEKVSMPMDETLHYLNRRILELFGKQITSSCTAIVLNDNLQIDLYNAGSPGWFLHSEGKARHLAMRSSMLGMTSEAFFAKETIRMSPSCYLFTFTDGYMEGARAFRRLISKMTTSERPGFTELQLILDEIGKSFRLEDDRSLLMVQAKDEALEKAG